MKPKYEIGTRLRGFAKNHIRNLNEKLSEDFNMKKEEKIIPHLTFLRPFYTQNEEQLISNFNQTLQKQKDPIYFTINNFGIFRNEQKTFYANIKQNPQIENLIGRLENSLEGIITYRDQKISLPEEENSINLHSTILKIPDYLLPRTIEYINKNPLKKIEQGLLRVYLLKDKKILREYDFFLEKSLERNEAKDKEIFQRTMEQFKTKTNLIPSPEGFLPKK
jgi:2'-5' RNA ligase